MQPATIFDVGSSIFSLIKNREAEKSEPVGRICGTPNAPGHEVQPVCFDTSELSFVLIVYQICFRLWHRSVTRFDSVCIECLAVPCTPGSRICLFRKVPAHYTSEVSATVVRFCRCETLRPQLCRRDSARYIRVYIHAASALFGDPSPKRLSDKMHRLSFRLLPRG